jgi:hypothetical protein
VQLGYVVRLTDDSPGIEIAKSGAPEPGAELPGWLARECRAAWSWDCDGAFKRPGEGASRYQSRHGLEAAAERVADKIDDRRLLVAGRSRNRAR